MIINTRFLKFHCYVDEEVPLKHCWFRLFGVGLSISNSAPMFSERNGYTKYVMIFGYKVKYLKR